MKANIFLSENYFQLRLSLIFLLNLGFAEGTLTINSRALLTGVEPKVGGLNGGLLLTITGNGFMEGVTTVNIGGSECNVVEFSHSRLVCRTEYSAEGTYDVEVMADTINYEGSIQFIYSSELTPIVTGVRPPSGPAGTRVRVSGTGFAFGSTVMIGATDCLVDDSSITETSLMCVTGNHLAGMK